jgi:hypothetical protein
METPWGRLEGNMGPITSQLWGRWAREKWDLTAAWK